MIHAGLMESQSREDGGQPTEIEGRALSQRKQLRILGIAAGVVVILLLAGAAPQIIIALGTGRAHPPATQPASGTFKPTAPQLETLTIAPVAAVSFRNEEIAEGNIAIDDDVATPVFSPYSGRVTRLAAKVGDIVAKGAPLMMVEASEFVQAQNDLVAAIGAADSTRAQLTLATRSEQRAHDLYDIKGAALKDWQQAQADVASAQSAVRSATAALAAVRNRLRIFGKTDAEIDALARAPEAAPINAEAAVTAPIGGTVIQRQVGLGQYIQANASTPVYSIGDLSKIWLVANVRETDAPKIRVGQLAQVRVLAYPDRVFTARVTTVGPAIDASIHRLPVRAEIDNSDGALKPQMFATFSIVTGDEAKSPAVPASAVITEGSATRVWVANDDGSLGLREIHTGRAKDHIVEVADGLVVGEKVVTAGALFIDRAAQAD